MNKLVSRLMAFLMALLLLPLPSLATCGGGGGGGMGGMRGPGGGGGGDAQVYQVPWKVVKPEEALPAGSLALYWFPSSVEEFKNSSLRNSRSLSLLAAQCVNMIVSDTQAPTMQKLVGEEKLPVAVLASSDGTAIGKAQNVKGFLKVDQVEKLVESEMKQREEAIKQQMKDGKEKNVLPVSTAEYGCSNWRWWLNNTTVTLGMQNVLDEDPPFVAGSFENGYDESLATIKGRFWYVGLKKRF